jgi:hypothetical protein
LCMTNMSLVGCILCASWDEVVLIKSGVLILQ